MPVVFVHVSLMSPRGTDNSLHSMLSFFRQLKGIESGFDAKQWLLTP